MAFACCRMLKGVSLDIDRFAIFDAFGNLFGSILCMFCCSGGSIPYSNAFIVGPKSPSGLIANGISCIFEL